ncbi:MAG: bifunctional glutamate N-acetyltransferase/amino-acid acetyltransferase ArgJ [Anaerolineae bacterium]
MHLLLRGTITSVPGFQAAGVACGLKKTGDLDLALVYSQAPCRAAAVFTTNRVKAAPVLYDQEILGRNREAIHAVIINSGGANACTGPQGLTDAREMACSAAAALGHHCDAALVMSTGVIGQRLDMAAIAKGIIAARKRLSSAGGHDAARAIMTTDTVPKEIALRVPLSRGEITIGGMAKGAGMIHPYLATMLVLLATDAAVSTDLLGVALRRAVDRSFHMITVDGDTSTNDTVLLLANGLAGNDLIEDETAPDFAAFQEGLTYAATELAKMIVRDGEGATKFVEVTVRGARSFAQAKQAAMAIARSNLVKTALFGQDANWGRVLAAVGYSGAQVDPARLALWFGDQQLVKDGQPFDVDEERAREILAQPEIAIAVDLGLGEGEATVWTCDLSYDYVKINAHYRT